MAVVSEMKQKTKRAQPRKNHNKGRRARAKWGSETNLKVTGPYQGIVAQIPANIGGDDLAVDAVPREEVLVIPCCRRACGRCPSGGGRCGPLPVVSACHF
jgi:hypothetical protein